uniref:Retrovirus-related Pol polyprotein from transposon TNT 1-94-like beta-barrel domain-containing protein n=1 Tax=Oryza glaberrima TaxID=4538 RepID=I1R231_ORYGL
MQFLSSSLLPELTPSPPRPRHRRRLVGDGLLPGLQVHGSGAVNTEMVAIPDVWYVPGINCNLVSVGQLCQLGLEVSIFRGVCTVTRASDGSVVGKANRSGAVYEVEFLKVPLN